MVVEGGVRVVVNQELKLLYDAKKKSGGCPVGGGQSDGVRRYWKLLKNALKKLGEGVRSGGGGGGSEWWCTKILEIIEKCTKKVWGGGPVGGGDGEVGQGGVE